MKGMEKWWWAYAVQTCVWVGLLSLLVFGGDGPGYIDSAP